MLPPQSASNSLVPKREKNWEDRPCPTVSPVPRRIIDIFPIARQHFKFVAFYWQAPVRTAVQFQNRAELVLCQPPGKTVQRDLSAKSDSRRRWLT